MNSLTSSITKTFFVSTAKWGLATAALALVSCATAPPVAPEDRVRAKATARWEALVAGKLPEAYAMITPSQRATMSLDTYRGGMGSTVKWESAEVIAVRCAEQKCSVRLRVTVKPSLPFSFSGSISTGLDESWVQEGNDWWFSIKP
jgi:hypothetical protein